MQAIALIVFASCLACALTACVRTPIYDGAYVWENYGWDGTIQQANSTYQFGGKPSVCWRASSFNGIYFHAPGATTYVANEFTYLHFWVNGMSGGQTQRVEFYRNDAIIGNQPLVSAYTGNSMPSTWTEVKIPLADFGLSGSQVTDGVVFQSVSSSPDLQNVLCYANITLECDGGPPPSPTSSAAPPPPSSYAGTGNSPNGPYKVSGNKILDKDNKVHIFRGFARPSLEWSATGEGMTASDYAKQAALGANVMRVSLNQNFWLEDTSGYKDRVHGVVTDAKATGMSVILDLHWSDKGSLSNGAGQQIMADTLSIQFWQEVATKYKDDGEVLFELYNEPHDVSCEIWMNGGASSDFTVAGMQQMYNAVRNTGANNIVIVSGLDYAYDLKCVKTNPLTGNNFAYNTHPYFNFYPKGTPALWDEYFGFLLPNYPVMATEFGNFDCSTPAYVTWLNYTRANGIHWSGWAWYPGGCGFPGLINGDGSLTAPGQLVAAELNYNRPPGTATAVATTNSATTVSTAANAASTTASASVTAGQGSTGAASEAGTTASASATSTYSATATTAAAAAAADAAHMSIAVGAQFVSLLMCIMLLA